MFHFNKQPQEVLCMMYTVLQTSNKYTKYLNCIKYTVLVLISIVSSQIPWPWPSDLISILCSKHIISILKLILISCQLLEWIKQKTETVHFADVYWNKWSTKWEKSVDLYILRVHQHQLGRLNPNEEWMEEVISSNVWVEVWIFWPPSSRGKSWWRNW